MTEQRKRLFAFLQQNHDKQFSAKQIASLLTGDALSLSAVYRNLASLEQEGLITRMVHDGSREIFYQYIQAEECRSCIHLTCLKCGKTSHMNGTGAANMVQNVLEADNFHVVIPKTVLYGVCSECNA